MTEVIKHTNNQVTIDLTPAAKKHILAYLDKQNNCCGVRFSVKKTGCSGYSYVIDYVNQAESNDITLPLADNYQLYIDKASYPFLKGTSVDYVQQGLNFKFMFNNPNQTGECGCGESFTIEDN